MSGITHVTEFTPTTFEQITVTSSATLLSALLSAGLPTGAKHAVFYPEGDVRWRGDGTSPTADVGVVMAGSAEEVWESQRTLMEAVEFIASGDTLVNIQFFK